MRSAPATVEQTGGAGALPRHVAIIMDGNGRWAKKRFLPRLAGHKAGVEAVRWFIFSLLVWVGLNTLSRDRVPMLALGIHLGAVTAALWTALQFWVDFKLFPQGPNPASTFEPCAVISVLILNTSKSTFTPSATAAAWSYSITKF